MIAMLLTLLATGALGPTFELEVAGGVAHSLESSPGYTYPFAVPAVQGRAAIDFAPGVAVGGTFLAVVGGEAPNHAGCCGSTTGNQAFSATAALITLRVRSSGNIQAWAEGGIGTGHLISLQTDDSFEHPPRQGHAGLAFRLAAGVRDVVAERLLLGAELAWMHWTNVEHGPGGGIGLDPAQSGLSTSALLLLVSVGFSVGR
jgi:hypothetical protein